MGLASEIDTLLLKQKENGLTFEEIEELKGLWEYYRELNELYGWEVGTLWEIQKEVMPLEELREDK
uniref:Uncharacterized protein n=1 Tax=viral metagenome TaxID=1070528 RepID=A0A6H2A4V0_9ZZZZ